MKQHFEIKALSQLSTSFSRVHLFGKKLYSRPSLRRTAGLKANCVLNSFWDRSKCTLVLLIYRKRDFTTKQTSCNELINIFCPRTRIKIHIRFFFNAVHLLRFQKEIGEKAMGLVLRHQKLIRCLLIFDYQKPSDIILVIY